MTSPDPEDLTGLVPLTWIEQQAGAVPYRLGQDGVQVAIITSRRTGRWVFPKGGVDAGMTPQETATQEALEEAGLVGITSNTPLGSYQSLKVRPPAVWTIEVTLYPMRVEDVLDEWKEADQRTRRFVSLAEARELLADPAIADLSDALARIAD